MSEVVSLTRIPKYADLVNGFPFKSSEFSPEGEVPLVRIRDLFAENFETFVPESSVPEHARLKDGDVVIGMDGDFNVRLWDRGDAALNQRLCYLRAKPNCDSRYIAYAIPSQLQAINDITPSTTVKHLSSNDVMGVSIPDYNLETQRRIADYLDRETGQIDAMIDKLGELDEALELRKADAIRTWVQTGGRKATKNSGYSRIGDIPDDYNVVPIQTVATMKTGHTPSRRKAAYWENTTIPWFTLADVWQLRQGRKYISETKQMISELGLNNSAAELLPAETVLLSRTASVGFTGIATMPMATSQDFWNWICGPQLLPEYLWYQFRSLREYFQSLTFGSTHRTIYEETAGGMRIVLPPLEEQRRIADHLDDVTSKIDTMLAKVAELKDLLTERRAALITDVVTGRKDVA